MFILNLPLVKKLWIVPTLAAAAIAAGCGSKPAQTGQGQDGTGWQTCTDQQGRVADERQCDSQASGYRPGLYRWYYYPYGGRIFPLGYGVPLGGTYSNAPVAGIPTRSIGTPGGGGAPRSGVVRGGFGKTGSGGTAAS
jgi:hypothetical protein